MITQPKLYVALDGGTRKEIIEKAEMVNSVSGDFGFKVNLDGLVVEGGPRLVSELVERFRRPVFPDLKMWNGVRTMSSLIRQLGEAGASLTNFYAQCGVKKMRQVLDEVRSAGQPIHLYGLGVLTHSTEVECVQLYGRTIAKAVTYFAEQVLAAGLDGYIQPGTMLEATSHLNLSRLVPAIRPDWYLDQKANNQEQVVTPTEAREGGARIQVCGSPIFGSPEPEAALVRILEEIQ